MTRSTRIQERPGPFGYLRNIGSYDKSDDISCNDGRKLRCYSRPIVDRRFYSVEDFDQFDISCYGAETGGCYCLDEISNDPRITSYSVHEAFPNSETQVSTLLSVGMEGGAQ